MEAYRLRKDQVRLESVVISVTSNIDYYMCRYVLLENLNDLEYNEYVIADASHCSCYGFDDSQWVATKYTSEEIEKLIKEKSKYENVWDSTEFKFYNLLKDYFDVKC